MNSNSKTFIITGGNSGLGYQCAKNIALTDKNYQIVIACRNPQKAANAVETLIKETGNLNIQALPLDLSSLDSIRLFYKKYSESNFPKLYALVCNAGTGAANSNQLTKDGFELTFGTNHLGHFLLTNLLLKEMSDNGRIVFVASDQHNPPKFLVPKFGYTNAMELAYPNFSIQKKVPATNGMFRYSISKLCNIYCAYEMAERIKIETSSHITINAFNPGFMGDTGLSGDSKRLMQSIARFVAPIIALLIGVRSTSKKSGRLLASLITAPQYEGISGKYFDRDKEVKSSVLSYNKEKAKDLWDNSVLMVNLHQHETILSI